MKPPLRAARGGDDVDGDDGGRWQRIGRRQVERIRQQHDRGLRGDGNRRAAIAAHERRLLADRNDGNETSREHPQVRSRRNRIRGNRDDDVELRVRRIRRRTKRGSEACAHVGARGQRAAGIRARKFGQCPALPAAAGSASEGSMVGEASNVSTLAPAPGSRSRSDWPRPARPCRRSGSRSWAPRAARPATQSPVPCRHRRVCR